MFLDVGFECFEECVVGADVFDVGLVAVAGQYPVSKVHPKVCSRLTLLCRP